MGAFGSILGGIMSISSLFLGIWVAFTFTDNMIALLLFTVFGILGRISLGALNSRKAKRQAKYRNEYTAYAGMAFAAIVFFGAYFQFLAQDTLENNVLSDEDPTFVLFLAVLSGILALLGVGLTVANMIAED